MSFPTLRCLLLGLLPAALLSPLAQADVLYTTGFETFTSNTSLYPHLGDDKIVEDTPDVWLGSTSASYGVGRSGVDSESVHAFPGLGNAGFIGGTYSQGVSLPGKSLNVRVPLLRTPPYYYSPVTSSKEVVFISALVGIKDSTTGVSFLKYRDNFELFIMNGATTATGTGTVLAAIQFDNHTLDSQGAPQQLVFRTQSSAGSTNLSYVSTGGYFIYDNMQLITVRINFRTNKWSSSLDGIPLFSDLTFYTGSAPLNLGAVGFRMNFGDATPFLSNYICNSGNNYMLFDDLRIEAEDRPQVAFTSEVKKTPGSFALSWNAEAGYRYNVYGSTTMGSWSLLTPTPLTATQTTDFTFTDTTVTGVTRRFYKLGPPLFP